LKPFDGKNWKPLASESRALETFLMEKIETIFIKILIQENKNKIKY
jgi:hypothetical protein